MYKRLFLSVVLSVFALGLVSAQSLPDFAFYDLQGNLFTKANIKKKAPVVVIFFDPYCDHCQTQAGWINAAGEKFKAKNAQVVWVSTESEENIAKFRNTTFTKSALKDVYFLRDKKYWFDGYFGYSEAPSIYVYNAEGKLVKSLKKETPAETLLSLF